MTMRFLKCLVLVALVHVFAAAMVFGAYHFTKAGNKAFAKNETRTDGAPKVLVGTTQNTPQIKTHKVRSGESYWSISKTYNLGMQNLMTHNGHKETHVLKVGDVIDIPLNGN